MISKNRIRFINTLSQKKQRIENNRFIIEGEKMVNEAILWIPELIENIYATSDFEITNAHSAIIVEEISPKELKEISSFTTPNKALAICKIPENKTVESNLIICLDGVQDPGNMGSIIRIADWFGITHVYCFGQCVDVFNPKVVQSTMGSLLRVNIRSIQIEEVAELCSKSKLIGATLGGDNIEQISKTEQMILVIGNESKGIRKEIIDLCAQCVTIPKKGHAESLNAAVATGILCHALLC